MKSCNNLYNKIHSLDNLKLAFKKARKGKNQKSYVKEFEANLEDNLLQLKTELEALTYKPRPLKTFVIRDPKTRVISASHFRDRIVHHALCNIIEPIFEKIFIHDSYASRKNKGTHAALRRFDEFKRKVSSNGRLVKNSKDNNMIIGYILKADIKHYFASVDHEILIRIIRRRIRDKKILWLIRKILKNHNFKDKNKGIIIGNLTSQLFANLYLNGLDYFAKQKLGAKYYIRYMDDFVLMYKSKETLFEWKEQISKFLKTIKLDLHQEKSKIFSLHKGTNFVGYRVFYHYKLLKKSNLKVIEKRIMKFRELYEKNEISYEKITQSLESWMAYAKYADTYKLRKKITKQFNYSFT